MTMPRRSSPRPGTSSALHPNAKTQQSQPDRARRAALMAAAQSGDADAYGQLLNEIGPSVMSFLRARVRDTDEAADLYQETFLALHRARHTYDPNRPLEPW